MRTENNHRTKPKAGRAKIPVNFIVMLFFAFSSLLFIVAGRVKSFHLTEGEALVFCWEYWLAGIGCASVSLLANRRTK